MDLKDFIANSLVQICQGIREAQEKTADTGAWISPATSAGLPGTQEGPRVLRTAQGSAFVHDVHFDVAITAADEQGANAGAGLKVFGVKLGAEGSVSYQNSAVSRIQFSVPVVWPGQIQPELENKLKEQREATKRRVSNARPTGWMGR